jgi:outer membrane autotransporter protein
MSRHYMNGAAVDSSNGKTNSNAYAISAKLDWKDAKTIGRFSLSPYAAYTWSQSKLDAYTETGGGFPAYFAASTWTTNDVRVGSAAKTALSPKTDLRLSAEVVHRFENNTSGVNGNVIGLWNFSLPGQQIKQSWTRVMVDVDHRISDKVAFTVGGNAATNGGDATWGVTAGLRANF